MKPLGLLVCCTRATALRVHDCPTSTASTMEHCAAHSYRSKSILERKSYGSALDPTRYQREAMRVADGCVWERKAKTLLVGCSAPLLALSSSNPTCLPLQACART